MDRIIPMVIDCRPLPVFAPDNLASVRSAFKSATPIPLGQAWLETPERNFAPATVRTGWRRDSLLVFADLWDADVFTLAKGHNERFWELGDTFEIFLQPEGSSSYVELHVAPGNLRLQLRFEKAPTAQDPNPFEKALIRTSIFDSRTWADADRHGWQVFADIPAAAVGGSASLAGSTWRFSFSRYDATRGREHPVISSSSPHTQAAFHRPDEWGQLKFTST